MNGFLNLECRAQSMSHALKFYASFDADQSVEIGTWRSAHLKATRRLKYANLAPRAEK